MLPTLFVVQICWWVLISSMIWRQLKSGQLREDIRSVNWCCTCRLRETAGLNRNLSTGISLRIWEKSCTTRFDGFIACKI
ncbi:hypothetical protein CICLE_v10027558mg [Citrus x clementina]|uniref:Secreted protein n=1 Tax=Citrus clementina TaxID=85681 RepID=V4S0G7_CITCL|nr:hypothetical protein CICLE_v10027558mg [Citrus x clementina]